MRINLEKLSLNVFEFLEKKRVWFGRVVKEFKDFLCSPLMFLAKRCVFASSSLSFKANCKSERIERSMQALRKLGGVELKIPMQDGHLISVMSLDAEKCLEALIQLGGRKEVISLDNDMIQEILQIPADKQELLDVIDQLKLRENCNAPILLGIPKKRDGIDVKSTVIYAPGSGHIFEFRTKTIGTLLINYQANVVVFHYSGTGTSEGEISERAVYENVEAIYNHLKEKGIRDDKILGYGHCAGGGPIVHLASKYPINLIMDRTFLKMGDFAALRVAESLHLPKRLYFLTGIITTLMNRCFQFKNIDKVPDVKGNVAVLGGTQDHIIPEKYIDELYDKAVNAKSRVKIWMDCNHDNNLIEDQSIRLPLGKFIYDH